MMSQPDARAQAPSGFSMIELLVVVLIVGVLAGIAIPVFTNQRSKGYLATAVSDGNTLNAEIQAAVASVTATGGTGAGITLSGSTLTVNFGTAPTPATPTSVSTTVKISPGTTLSGTATMSVTNGAPSWCFVLANNDTYAKYTRSGLATQQIGGSAPSCSADSGYTRVNRIPNPSAETNVTATFMNRGTLTRTTAAAHSGTASILGTAEGTGTFGPFPRLMNNALFPATPGTVYTFSGYVRDVNTSVQYRASFQWFDVNGTYMSTTTGTATAVTTTGWTRVSITATAPANTAFMEMWINATPTPAAGTQAYFDSLLGETGGTLDSYFDGSSPGAVWTGTPHGSTSAVP